MQAVFFLQNYQKSFDKSWEIQTNFQEKCIHIYIYWKQEAHWASFMHLNTSLWNGTHADNDQLKKQQEAKRATYRSPEYNLPHLFTYRRGRQYLVFRWAWTTQSFLMGPENTRGHWDLASFQVFWILFSSFRGEVEKYLSQSEVGAAYSHLSFLIDPKHKLGSWRWDLASCQVSLNFIQQFQRSRKYLSQSEAGGPSYFFDRPEKHKLGRGLIQSNTTLSEGWRTLNPSAQNFVCPWRGLRSHGQTKFCARGLRIRHPSLKVVFDCFSLTSKQY